MKMMTVMNTLMAYYLNFKSEKGQGLAEYALIIVLVSIAVVATLTLVGGEINTTFNDIVESLQTRG
jgi:pilus assembly protein Flp/PilA